jgi:hypothetical protein
MVRVKQQFAGPMLHDVAGAVRETLSGLAVPVKPGQTVALAVGSRGIVNIDVVARACAEHVKRLGAKPFIFPAMGSHGAATAEGQKKVLEGYGISEATTGVPVRATMDTVIVGTLADGTPVHMDRFAAEADGIVVINRIKPHTAFRGATESGITKMLAIGIGKIIGAATYHQHGMDTFPELLPKVRDVNLARRDVLFGVGIVENAHDQTAAVEVIPSERIAEREPVLQDMAKKLMPQLFFDEVDVLIIDEMGKNISGAGFDPNITGRNRRAVQWNYGPLTKKIVVLGLTPETHGNATGMGGADIITMRLFREIDIPSTYANIITSMHLDGGAIPMVMNTEQEAVQLAVKTVVRVKPQDCRIVRIRNTLELAQIQVSEPLLAEVRARPDRFQIASPPVSFTFDAEGRLASLVSAREASTRAAAGR